MADADATRPADPAGAPDPAGMEAWASGHAAAGLVVSPKVDFFSPSAAGGCGGRAKTRVAAGEVLLQIPLQACLTPMDLPGAPAFMDEQQKLMLRLLHESLVVGEKSAWRAYLDSLPREFPTMPLSFTPKERELLRGTSVDVLLSGRHIANHEDLEAIAAWCATQPALFPPRPPRGGAEGEAAQPVVGLKELRWAACVVASRAFESAAAGVALVPFADALNHSGAQPHTRMRDCDHILTFVAEVDIAEGKEVMNTYGEHGNTQWLLNGGFVDASNPFEEVLLSSAEVVSVTMAYLREETGHGSEGAADSAAAPDSLARLGCLQESGLLGDTSLSIRMDDLLPNGLVTIILVLCMSEAEFAAYEAQASDEPMIDIADRDVDARLLMQLYTIVLGLVTLLEERYPTSLEEDCALLAKAEAKLAGEPPPKRRRGSAALNMKGVRTENLRNVLLLRIGQKRILKQLKEHTLACFDSDDDDEDGDDDDEDDAERRYSQGGAG